MDSITLELNNWGFYWDSKNIYTCKDKYSYLQYNRDENAPHIKIAADFLRFLASRGVEVDGLALVAGDEDGELHERPVPDAEDRQAQDLVRVHFGVLEIYPQISTAFILLLVHRYFAQYYHVDIVVLILNRIVHGTSKAFSRQTPWMSRRIQWCLRRCRCSRAGAGRARPLSWCPAGRASISTPRPRYGLVPPPWAASTARWWGAASAAASQSEVSTVVTWPRAHQSQLTCSMIITSVSLSTFGIGGSSTGIFKKI